MSTVCKLFPKVRQDRYARRALLRQARAVHGKIAAQAGVGSRVEYQAYRIADFLEQVYRSAWRTGSRKNELFQALARELASVQPAR